MRKFLLTLLVLLSVVACNIDNSITFPQYPIIAWYWQPNQANGNNQYLIGGYVSSAQLTRAYSVQTSDLLSEYSEFSLFAWAKDSVPMNNFHGNLNAEQGTWGYNESKKYFDNNQDSYSFIGVIPYSDSYAFNQVDSTVNIPLTDFVTEGIDVNSQKYNKEFIVAKTTVEKANYPQGATLSFEHQNSIIRIKFETNSTNTLEILDFTPYKPGTPAQAAWDETIDVTSYQMTATTVPNAGPSLNDIDISDEDINYINSKYTASKGFTNYQTQNVITGNLDENMWEYLLSKYPTLSTIDLGNWSTYVTNSNMRLINLSREGNNNTYRGVFVNVQNVNWNNGTTTQTIVHHDAVPEVPATGKEGIVVLPATSANQTGKDAVLSTFPEIVTAKVGLNGIAYTVDTTEDEIVFTKPGVVAYSIYSPTNWYTFPITHDADFGFTIKFSYKLNGVTRYDARVFVNASKCNWQAGKWYDYVIKVNSDKHGKSSPDDVLVDPTDPKIEEEYPINVSSTMNNYAEGETHNFEL